MTEGNHCFNPATGCSFAGITLPVAEYSHASGCSITGGFVYRGNDFARLSGIYFYADYCSGRVWGLRRGASGWETQELLRPGFAFTSFGEDDAGEVYAVDGTSGTLYRLVDADGPLSVLTVPVVVDAAGANGERFVSEITLGNRGTTDASVEVTFTAASALGSTGSGTFTTAVPAGRQLVFTDAIQWLRDNGLPVPSGGQGGTLRLAYSGLSSGDAAFASVRTLAVLPEGRAGLAYPALSPNETLEAPAALYGLRENTVFRSNLALVNAGDPTTGRPVTLQVTVFNGASGDARSTTLPDGHARAGPVDAAQPRPRVRGLRERLGDGRARRGHGLLLRVRRRERQPDGRRRVRLTRAGGPHDGRAHAAGGGAHERVHDGARPDERGHERRSSSLSWTFRPRT